MLRTINVALLLLALSGCTFSKKTPNDMKAEAVDEVSKKISDERKEAALIEQDVTVEFIGLSEPNQYKLRVKANKKVPYMSLQVEDQRPVTFKDTDVAEYVIENEWRIRLSLKTLTKDKTHASEIYFGMLEVPRDLYFEQNITLDNNFSPIFEKRVSSEEVYKRKFSRIIFAENVVINLKGHDLRLDADQIIFNNNTIGSFTSKSGYLVAAERQAYIDGSNIEITAKSVVGSASIIMAGIRGERGIHASEIAAKNPHVFSPARSGKDGSAAVVKQAVGMKSLDGAPSIKTLCVQEATDGENGQDGAIIHGRDGTRGGDTGDLIIDVADYSKARFQVLFIPGKGGKGGEGDFMGQQGGAGGKAGRTYAECKRRPADGRAGRSSVPNDSLAGRDGEDGREGRLLVPSDNLHFMIQKSYNSTH